MVPSATCLIVRLEGGEAKVETVVNEYMALRPEAGAAGDDSGMADGFAFGDGSERSGSRSGGGGGGGGDDSDDSGGLGGKKGKGKPGAKAKKASKPAGKGKPGRAKPAAKAGAKRKKPEKA
jgi:hypothetical protein